MQATVEQTHQTQEDKQSPRSEKHKENSHEHSKSRSQNKGEKRRYQSGGYRRSRSHSRNRRFVNYIERWHYQRCSEIKIHFYVKNLFIGKQSEDAYLNFVRDRVQKAGHCDLIQISGKNKQDQTIDIAIGMRYDQDAKLIYIGKKHINLASKFTINQNKQICPVISNIFEIMLEKNDELDKSKLEDALKKQRKRDHSGKRKGSSSSKSGSKSSSKKSKSSVSSKQSKSRSRSKSKGKLPVSSAQKVQPQIRAQLPIEPIRQDIKPAQLQPQKTQGQAQISYKPVLLSMNENIIKEQVQVFCIPKEFPLDECLESVREQLGLSSPPEGQFKLEKNKTGDQVFEYLEITLEYPQIQKLLKTLPLRIKDVPCLACQRSGKLSFRDVLKPFQLFVSPAQRVASRMIYTHFKNFGEIVAFYNVDSQIRDAEDYILIFAQDISIIKLSPPNSLEVAKDLNTKVICNFRYLESVDIQFQRPPFVQTIYAQSQLIQKQQQQRQEQKLQAQPPLQQQTQIHQQKVKTDIISESSSTGSSSSKKSGSRSSRSGSSGSRNHDRAGNSSRHYQDRNRKQYDNRRGHSNNNNYQRNNNYRNNRGGSYQDEDRRRGGGSSRYNQRQDRGRRYEN